MKISGNEDVILEIFYRLPIKSLFKFKVVCKRWHSLISHPTFPYSYSKFRQRLRPASASASGSVSGFFCHTYSIRDHGYKYFSVTSSSDADADADADALVPPDPSLNFLTSKVPLPPEPSLPLLRPDVYASLVASGGIVGLRIWHSCNGLLLCSAIGAMDVNYYVCNPITKQFAYVRSFPSRSRLKCCGLAFDPSKSLHYKAIFIEPSSSNEKTVNIYSCSSENLSTSCFSNIYFPELYTRQSYNTVILWKGVLHWDDSVLSSVSTTPPLSTVYFDLETERLGATRRNSYDAGGWFHSSFVASPAYLNLIEFQLAVEPKIGILEMDHDWKHWNVKYHLNLPLQLYGPRRISRILYLVRGHGPRDSSSGKEEAEKEKEEEEDYLWIHVFGKIISYRIRDGACEDMCQVPIQGGQVVQTYPYTCPFWHIPLLSFN